MVFNPHPPKPELVEQKTPTNWKTAIFSLLLFILVFMVLFANQIELILGIIVVLLLHELGHFAIMKWFHYQNIRPMFIPLMGAWVRGEKKTYSQKECLIVAGAGPFPGLLLGFLLLMLSQFNNSVELFHVGLLFFTLNIINLVPLDPLDGGQMFKLLVRENHEKFLMYFTFIASFIVIAIGFYFDSYFLMIFGFLMSFRVRALQKRYHLHRDLHEEKIPFVTTYKELSDLNFWRIREVILERKPNLKAYLQDVQTEELNMFLASQVNAILITPVKQDASLLLKLSIISLWIASLASPLFLFWLLDMNWVHYVFNNWSILN